LGAIEIEILNPIPGLDVVLARTYSDPKNSNNLDSNLLVIGIGDLASQFFMNLTRNSFGRWNLIDPNSLRPHNVIRHVSTKNGSK
jgi:tRNA A37 threonylcarbamoyladenosine dehydratase